MATIGKDNGVFTLCYVQWESEQAHLDCYNNPDLREPGEGVGALATSGKAQMAVTTYDIVRSDEAA